MFALRPKRLTVLYDGDCGFCSLTVDILGDLDLGQHLEFVPLQHARAHAAERPELAGVADSYPLEQSIPVRRADGHVSAGGEAVLEILEALPAGWLFRPWSVIPGMTALLDAGYNVIADRRGQISRLINRLGGRAPTCDLQPRPHAAGDVAANVDDG